MITPELCAQLGITEPTNSITEEAFVSAIKKNAESVAKIPQLEASIQTLTNEKTALATAKADLSNALETLKKETASAKIDDMLNKALAENKITAELQATLKSDYAENAAGLEKLLGAMPAYTSIVSKISELSNASIPDKFKGKTYMELHQADMLEEVKAKHPAYFDHLKKEHENK